MSINKLSIIIPVFNEDTTVYEVLRAVSAVKLIDGVEKEIIVVNDCSTDESEREILSFISDFPSEKIKYIRHEVNHGKGASVSTAIAQVTGDFVIIQDADLELQPGEINILLQAAADQNADAVFGSRFLKKGRAANQKKRHYAANIFLTRFSNLFTGLRLTDMGTCYKLVRTSILQQITIEEKRFGMDPELTAKLAKMKGLLISEAPISYSYRTVNEGKKIGWKDGLRSVYCTVRYSLFN
jgi:glycosyltransferase involved in cell wall biosynthesis